MNINQLNSDFSLEGSGNSLCFRVGEGDIPVVEIHNQQASAVISLQGAHTLSWIPVGEEEVIWLSEDAKFVRGKSVRGGIPICWPWFGAHETSNDFPAHGFARTVIWQVTDTKALDNGETRIRFTTTPNPDHELMWPDNTTVSFEVSIGRKFQMELVTTNNGNNPYSISQALHTYFNVGDVANLLLHGLEDTDYLDKCDNFNRKVQRGSVIINEETDRIYLNTTRDCVIEDKTLNRNIVIKKHGSHSTVVWNPWQEVADKMGDLGAEGYKKMICVESSNAADDVVIIEPGKSHSLRIEYEVQH